MWRQHAHIFHNSWLFLLFIFLISTGRSPDPISWARSGRGRTTPSWHTPGSNRPDTISNPPRTRPGVCRGCPCDEALSRTFRSSTCRRKKKTKKHASERRLLRSLWSIRLQPRLRKNNSIYLFGTRFGKNTCPIRKKSLAPSLPPSIPPLVVLSSIQCFRHKAHGVHHGLLVGVLQLLLSHRYLRLARNLLRSTETLTEKKKEGMERYGMLK